MRTAQYIIPYYYDEVDEAWPVKYLNDLSTQSWGVTSGGEGNPPSDAHVTVTAVEATHTFLVEQPDVIVVAEEFELKEE